MNQERVAHRKPYTSPTLKKFGVIKDLNSTKLVVQFKKIEVAPLFEQDLSRDKWMPCWIKRLWEGPIGS